MISFWNTLTVCVSRMRPLERSVCRTLGHDWGAWREIEAGWLPTSVGISMSSAR